MTSSEPIVNSLLNRLTETKRALLMVSEEHEKLLKDVAALEQVVQMYTGEPTQGKQTDSSGLTFLTLAQGLKKIAREHDGILKVVQAKRQLLESGKITNPKNASARLYSHLSRDPHFEWVAPGQFRLIDIDVDSNTS